MVRIAAVGDLHYSKTSQGTWQPLFAQIGQLADLLLLCGDLTDYGLAEEGEGLAREIKAAIKIPVVAVLGNHDFECGKTDELRRILIDGGVNLLDGEACEVHGLGVAGVKGFCGGFGQRALGAWGEDSIKHFVREAVEEALKLETALARIRTLPSVALLHYSPVQGTVEGEPLEIYPFLGSSRLEEPINTYRVSLVVHSHAHRGRPEGKTSAGVPVYNVSMPLLTRTFGNVPPFRVFDIPAAEPSAVGAGVERRAGDRRR
jgi:Icc-related predicted phosphoesterase